MNCSTILVKGSALTAYLVFDVKLVSELQKLGLWDDAMRNELLRSCGMHMIVFIYFFPLIQAAGSVQSIDRIPMDVKKIFKTAWEIRQDTIVRHAASRAPFVCQSQSVIMYHDGASRHWLVSQIVYYQLC